MHIFKDFKLFIVGVFSNIDIIKTLIINDFKAKFIGSYLSFFWSFIQPLVMIGLFWFIFQVGFKSQPINNIPFVLWLFAGIIPWFFFSESINGATNSILDSVYLVKKVKFRVSLLPIIKVMSMLIVHIIFIVITSFIMVYYGFYPNIYWLQIIYYLFAMLILIIGISWLTSSLIVFMKDVGQIVTLFLQIGFWLTPIFWSLTIVPERFHFFLKLNPLYYIAEGYRNSLLYNKWFWEDLSLTLYFWVVTISLFILGALVFRKSRKHFADVL